MRLTVTSGADAGRSLEFDGRLVVGREDDCDLVVNDDRASRRHCALTPQADGTVLLEDLGSSNGTFVNGERIESLRVLKGGEEIRVGGTILRVDAARSERSTVVAEPSRTVVAVAPPTELAASAPPPAAAPSRQWWRSRWVFVSAAAVLLAAGGAVGGVLATSGGDSEPVAATSAPEPDPITAVIDTGSEAETGATVETGAAVETGAVETGAVAETVDEATAALLTHVPEDQQQYCEPVADGGDVQGWTAGVSCLLPTGVQVWYFQMPSADEMNSVYSDLVGARPLDAGQCGQSREAESSYSIGNETAGRLACFPSAHGPSVTWTHDTTAILSQAVRDDRSRAALFEWWSTEGGPV